MIDVELASEVVDTLRAMKDRGAPLPRCHKGPIRSAIAGSVGRLVENTLDGGVRPRDLPALRRRAAALGHVSSARAVSVDENVLVAELLPGGERLLFRGVELHGWGPESALSALGLVKPDDVDLEYLSEDLGQGETETRRRYQWTEAGRSILAEEVKNEVFDGATPYSTYLRGVIIDGDGGVVLTGRDDCATVTEG